MNGIEYNFKIIRNTYYIWPFDLLPYDIQINNCNFPLTWEVQLLRKFIRKLFEIFMMTKNEESNTLDCKENLMRI